MKNIQELIEYWEQKKFEMIKSSEFLLLDPERAKPYLETIPIIERTICALKLWKMELEINID